MNISISRLIIILLILVSLEKSSPYLPNNDERCPHQKMLISWKDVTIEITQSATSQPIRSLESWVGLQRRKKGVPVKRVQDFALQTIQKGAFIVEYEGTVVSEKEYDERCESIYKDSENHCGFSLGNGFVTDGNIEVVGPKSKGRIFNHSCQPNADANRLEGFFRVGIYALRKISIGEEITMNYRFTEDSPCNCGEKRCCKTLAKK